MSGTYEGRLAADGNGNLLAHEATLVGTKTFYLCAEDGSFMLDDDGERREVVENVYDYGADHGKPVKYDPTTQTYVFVSDGEPSHNDDHHKSFAQINGTSGPLYDADGNQVYPGDAHHFFPAPDDPHFDEDGGKFKTTVTTLKDDEAPTATGHTAAYVDAHKETA